MQELRRGVRFAVAPVQETLADGTRSVTDVLGAFGEIEGLRRENHRPARHASSSSRTSWRTLDAVIAGERAPGAPPRRARPHRVRDHRWPVSSSRQATQFERVITIDRGTDSGIREGAPVLSEGGALAGRVTEVGEGWASVMLISDTRSLVIGLDSRTRATGEVTGRLSAPLAMAKIPRTDSIEVNDRIVTAGIDLGKRFQSSFPKNIPIGRVVDVQAGARMPSCRPRSCSRRPTSTTSRTSSSSPTGMSCAAQAGRTPRLPTQGPAGIAGGEEAS